MKKVMLLAAVIGFSAAAFAQDATPAKQAKHPMKGKTEAKADVKADAKADPKTAKAQPVKAAPAVDAKAKK